MASWWGLELSLLFSCNYLSLYTRHHQLTPFSRLSLTYLQNRYTSYSTHGAEEFNTASRSVKPGLIAAGIVSSWTWSATLLTSSTFSYSYGICGGMWYAAMGTWQILLFALIAIKIKANAPGAHTFPEIVLSRHGKAAHIIYLFFGWATNMLVGACLVLGGSQVVSALSGVNVYAACFLSAYKLVSYLSPQFKTRVFVPAPILKK